MKKLIQLLLLLIATTRLTAQQLPDYERTKQNQVLSDRATWSKAFANIPHGATPYFPAYVPDSLKKGALFYKVSPGVDTVLYVYNGIGWDRIAKTKEVTANLASYVKNNSGSGVQTLYGKYLFANNGPILANGATFNFLNYAGNASLAIGSTAVSGNHAIYFPGNEDGIVLITADTVTKIATQSYVSLHAGGSPFASDIVVNSMTVGLGNNSVTNNTAFGYQALFGNTTGNSNAAIGYQALLVNTSGGSNSAIGYRSLYYNTTGANNTGIGAFALTNNTTGNNNIAIGRDALAANTNGSGSVAVGNAALISNSGDGNTAVGTFALLANTLGGSNSAFGYQSQYHTTTGNNNSSFGYSSLIVNTTGGNNSAFGYYAMQQNTTGSNNVGIGDAALAHLQIGSNNVGIGVTAGYSGDVELNTYSNSTFLGYQARASLDGITNSTALGANAIIAASNQVAIGNTSVTSLITTGAINPVTTTERIALTPATPGYIAYDTTLNAYFYWNGTAWTSL